MIISPKGPQNVGQIEKQFACGNLFLSPKEYQRENAWRLPQKRLLIDTIFRGMDIPKFYLWRIDQRSVSRGYPDGEARELYKRILEKKRVDNDDPDPYVFEVVDGQQRIRTILEFMGVKPPNDKCYRGPWLESFPSLPETPMAKGRHYGQLNAEQQIKFYECPLSVMVLEDATIHEIRDMFLRLQNGTPLNAQQKRDAMGSSMGRIARELADERFFKVSVNFDKAGATHHLVASQMVQLELKDKIVSCTSPQLDKLYEHYRKVPVDSVIVAGVKKIVGVLGKVFPERNPHLNQNYAVSLYWLFSRLLLTYDIPEDQYPKIRQNFEKTDVARLEAMERDYAQSDDDVYEDLSLAMSRGNTGVDGISTRHDVIGRFLFDGVQLAERPGLDPQRNFTHEEKLILYHRSKGRCQLEHNGRVCGRTLPFDNAVVDHITPHSKGGKTQLANGRIAYKFCNIARSNRDDFNPETDCHLIAAQESVVAEETPSASNE